MLMLWNSILAARNFMIFMILLDTSDIINYPENHVNTVNKNSSELKG